jgi:membrane-associated phospholipid phosphatase
VLPVAVAVPVYRRCRREVFDEFVLSVVGCFYLCYAGYLLFPAVGPRMPAPVEDVVIGGGAFSRAVRAFIRAAEYTRTDAFPSGHTAVALVCCAQAWRWLGRSRFAVAVVAAGIVAATVYLHYHYLVDVLAGVAVAAAAVAGAPRAASVLGRVAGSVAEPRGGRVFSVDRVTRGILSRIRSR